MFFRVRTEYRVFNPNVWKYGPEKLLILALFTQRLFPYDSKVFQENSNPRIFLVSYGWKYGIRNYFMLPTFQVIQLYKMHWVWTIFPYIVFCIIPFYEPSIPLISVIRFGYLFHFPCLFYPNSLFGTLV